VAIGVIFGQGDEMADEMADVLHQAREAIRLTREYVDPACYSDGPKLLPEVEGWSWYDAVVAIDAVLGDGPSSFLTHRIVARPSDTVGQVPA
jgi:hypothetical protein